MLGDFWSSLSDDPAVVVRFLDAMDQFEVTPVCGHGGRAEGPVEAALMTLDFGPFSVALWLGPHEGGFNLLSVYPFIRDGARVECKIEDVLSAPDGVDGFIQAVGHGESFTFMDVLFNANQRSYRQRDGMVVHLGGFMLHARPFQRILDAMGGDLERQQFMEQLDERGGVLVIPSPSAQQAPQSYLYMGPIGAVIMEEVMGLPVYRTSLRWSLGCSEPISLPVVFGANTLTPGVWIPQEGQFISAEVLLQGCEAHQI